MSEPANRVYEFREFRLDLTNKLLLRNGIPVSLTPKVFDTLAFLVERPGQLIEKDEFVRQLWPETFVEDAALAENISRLRRALGAESQGIIATVPKRGYRFVAEVRTVDAADAIETATAPRQGAPSPRNWPRRALLVAAVLLVVGGTSFYFRHANWMFSLAPPARTRALAVLPLEDLSRDPKQEYFADGMTDELITQLANISSLRVISRTSVMRYKATQKPLAEIAYKSCMWTRWLRARWRARPSESA